MAHNYLKVLDAIYRTLDLRGFDGVECGHFLGD